MLSIIDFIDWTRRADFIGWIPKKQKNNVVYKHKYCHAERIPCFRFTFTVVVVLG